MSTIPFVYPADRGGWMVFLLPLPIFVPFCGFLNRCKKGEEVGGAKKGKLVLGLQLFRFYATQIEPLVEMGERSVQTGTTCLLLRAGRAPLSPVT